MKQYVSPSVTSTPLSLSLSRPSASEEFWGSFASVFSARSPRLSPELPSSLEACVA